MQPWFYGQRYYMQLCGVCSVLQYSSQLYAVSGLRVLKQHAVGALHKTAETDSLSSSAINYVTEIHCDMS